MKNFPACCTLPLFNKVRLLSLSTALFLSTVGGYAQSKISGKIVDPDDRPLTGATILVNQGESGTNTDQAGEFSILINNSGVLELQISYIGFENQRLSIDASARKLPLKFVLQPKPVAFEEIVVKATRAAEKDPITFTNLEKEQIEANNLGQDIPYILKWIPSTVVTSDAGTGIGYTGLRIRGVDPTRINVTINGVPLNDAESQGVFWVDLPDFASSANSVQIQRGLGTSTNGPAAFGASINLNTSVLNMNPYGQVSTSMGSFNTLRGNVSFGTGLINDHFTFDGRISKIDSDGYIDRASVDLSSYYLSGAYIGKKSSLRLNIFSGHEVTYQAWNGVPAQYIEQTEDPSLRTYNSAGTQRKGSPHENEVDDYQQDHYQLIYLRQLNDNWDFNLTGNYTRGKGFFELYQGDASLEKYQLPAQIIDGDNIDRTDLIERRWLDNDFYFGSISGNYSSADQTRQMNLGMSIGHYLGDHFGEVIWARYAGNTEQNQRYYENDGQKTDFNFFAKGSVRLAKKLIGFVDFQYRNVGYNFQGFDNNGLNVDQNVHFNFFNPKLGLTHELSPTTSLYAYFGIGNKEPNRSDFVDTSPNSRPTHETLYDTEIGLKKQWQKGAIEANIYYMDYKNQLVLTGQINDVGEYTRANIPDSYRLGLELVGGVQLNKNLNFEGALTFSNNKINSFTEYIDNWDTWSQETIAHGKTDLSFSPETIINGTLTYEALKEIKDHQLTISLSNKYVGKQFIDNTSNTFTQMDAFSYSDLRINYKLNTNWFKQISLTLMVRNLFDAQYITNAWTYRYISANYDGRPDDPTTRLESGNTYNLTGFYPQAGRNYLLGLNLNF